MHESLCRFCGFVIFWDEEQNRWVSREPYDPDRRFITCVKGYSATDGQNLNHQPVRNEGAK